MYKFVKPIYVLRPRGATLSNHLQEEWQTEVNVQLQYFDNLLRMVYFLIVLLVDRTIGN